MAQAGLVPVAERRLALAARAKARALLSRSLMQRSHHDSTVHHHDSTVPGWMAVGEEVWRATGVIYLIQPIFPQSPRP